MKKTKKSQEKNFFFQKNASKAVKNLYTKKWPKFFYNESDSKMVKNLCTKKWLKIFLAILGSLFRPKKFLVTF